MQVARGMNFRKNSFNKFFNIITIVIPTLNSLLERSDNLSRNLEARGFTHLSGKSYNFNLKFKTSDYVSFIFILLIFTSIIGVFYV